MCLFATTLKPQNLVQNANSKTHLTNHCFGIRCGKSLHKVVNATGLNTNPHSHISIRYKIQSPSSTTVNRLIEKGDVYCL